MSDVTMLHKYLQPKIVVYSDTSRMFTADAGEVAKTADTLTATGSGTAASVDIGTLVSRLTATS